MKRLMTIMALALPAGLGGCSGPWNDPYPLDQAAKNILYSSFSERPKHLDPVQSYAENEAVFTAQIATREVARHAAQPARNRPARGIEGFRARHEMQEGLLRHVGRGGGGTRAQQREAVHRVLVATVQSHEGFLVTLLHAGEEG